MNEILCFNEVSYRYDAGGEHDALHPFSVRLNKGEKIASDRGNPAFWGTGWGKRKTAPKITPAGGTCVPGSGRTAFGGYGRRRNQFWPHEPGATPGGGAAPGTTCDGKPRPAFI